MSADGVEVAQHRGVQLGVGSAAVGEDALGKGLGGAVGVGGSAHGEILTDGHAGGVTVDGGGRGEDDVMAVVAAHNIQDVQRAVQVVGVVLDGLGDTFTNRLVGSELDDAVDIGILGKDFFHSLFVGHIRFHKAEILTGDLFDAGQCLGAGIVEVVRNDDVVSRGEKFYAGVAADVAGATANQNCHTNRLLYVFLLLFCGQRLPASLLSFYFFWSDSGIDVFGASLSFCCLFWRRAGSPCCMRR